LRVNRELAELLRCEPAPLAFGAEAALHDEVVLCGLLGGKDVGKSTLVNALAAAAGWHGQASIEHRVRTELLSPKPRSSPGRPDRLSVAPSSPGTDRPIAFVHEDMRSAVTDRLHDLTRHAEVGIVTHRSDPLRSVVLVDLPDFDSEFPDHLAIVRAIAPMLDRVAWVLTPRKIGDRAWVEMFHSVVKDTRNVRCVLNKIDELLTDGDALAGSNGDPGRAEAFWNRQKQWVAASLVTAGFDSSDDAGYLIASGFPTRGAFRDRIASLWDDPAWERYASDKSAVEEVARRAEAEFARLSASVLSPLSPDEVASLKRANRDRELVVGADRIRRHFDVDRRIAELADACEPEYLQSVMSEAFEPAMTGAVGAALEADLRPDARLADELLDRRIEGYPLLRVAAWPLGWLSRIVGRRIGPGEGARPVTPADPFDAGGLALDDRIDGMKARLLSDHAALDARLGLSADMPETKSLAGALRRSVAELGPRLERRLIDSVRADDRRPSRWLSLFLWSVLLWFPLIQPIAAGLLEMAANPEMKGLAQGTLQIVLAFGAANLLAGFAVVGVVYVIVLAVMFARARKAVRKARFQLVESTPILDAVDDALTDTILLPLARPFHRRLERLTTLSGELDS
jgi:hypothetical protein